MDLNEIIEKLKDILSEEKERQKVLDRDVALALHIHPQSFACMKSRQKIPYEEILAFCAKRKISANWLFYNQAPESLIDTTNQYCYIRYFSQVHASAGGGAFNDTEACERIKLDAFWVERLGGEKEIKQIEAIAVTGDSMEPTLEDGDLIFIHRQKRQISKGGIFVIQTPHGIFVKRLQERLDGGVDILSDNSLYPTQTLERDGIEVIGRVVGALKNLE